MPLSKLLSSCKMQKQFNDFVFALEQAEYAREGVTWSFVDFPSNASVVQLLEGRKGVLALLSPDMASELPDATWDGMKEAIAVGELVWGAELFAAIGSFDVMEGAGGAEEPLHDSALSRFSKGAHAAFARTWNSTFHA